MFLNVRRNTLFWVLFYDQTPFHVTSATGFGLQRTRLFRQAGTLAHLIRWRQEARCVNIFQSAAMSVCLCVNDWLLFASHLTADACCLLTLACAVLPLLPVILPSPQTPAEDRMSIIRQ